MWVAIVLSTVKAMREAPSQDKANSVPTLFYCNSLSIGNLVSIIYRKMESEILLTILGGSFLFGICYWARQKRKQITRRCPKCGAICHADGSSTGLRNAYGPVHSFKCHNCGNKFML